MIERYSAPYAKRIFSDDEKIRRWCKYTRLYAAESMDEAGQSEYRLELANLRMPTPAELERRESETGHDVVAFLSLLNDWASPQVKRHIHQGLTSSDLVENAHHDALYEHARRLAGMVVQLRMALQRWENMETARAGRTHGQIAAPTSWGYQMYVYDRLLVRIEQRLSRFDVPPIKSPGPTGNDPLLRQRGREVAKIAGGEFVPSTQIIPRDYQLEWASVYLRLVAVLENLALLIRLGSRAEIAEVREGGTSVRVGSSSMPHKKNPIDSEKVSGLARVARGYFSTIAENVAFWEDRDLSNSSVERVTIPDYAAVVEHMTSTMEKVIRNLDLDYDRMRGTLSSAAPWTALAQTLIQKFAGWSSVEASDFMRDATFNPNKPWQEMATSLRNNLHELGFDWADLWLEQFEDVVTSAFGSTDAGI